MVGEALAGHPKEDFYKSDFIARTSISIVGIRWLQVNRMSKDEATELLRKEYSTRTDGDEHFTYRARIDEHGLAVQELIDAPEYEVRITTAYYDNAPKVYDVDFRLKSNPSKTAIARAKIVQEELESQAFRTVLKRARKEYTRLLVFSGEKEAEEAFARDFTLPEIKGVSLSPRLITFEDECWIAVDVAGEGIVGHVHVSARNASMPPVIGGGFKVHVWAK